MVHDSVTYVGMRGPQPSWGHGGALVVGVRRNGEEGSALTLDDDRFLRPDEWGDYPGFEWGYEGSGPHRLAQAILNDFLGFKPDLHVGEEFMRDVVARLPSEFEISAADLS